MTRTASCIYEGTIRHRRVEPRREFRHRLALFYVDLDELPALLGGRLVARHPGFLRFRRRDYLERAEAVPLGDAVREEVEAQTGLQPEGPIRLLTQALHLSPFMSMDQRYVARAGVPGESHAIHVESRRNGAPTFDATLALRRCELTRRSSASVAARYPLANVRVLALIYGHAVGLKLAGAPVHRHPARGAA